jgi:hypothetical protein
MLPPSYSVRIAQRPGKLEDLIECQQRDWENDPGHDGWRFLGEGIYTLARQPRPRRKMALAQIRQRLRKDDVTPCRAETLADQVEARLLSLLKMMRRVVTPQQYIHQLMDLAEGMGGVQLDVEYDDTGDAVSCRYQFSDGSILSHVRA